MLFKTYVGQYYQKNRAYKCFSCFNSIEIMTNYLTLDIFHLQLKTCLEYCGPLTWLVQYISCIVTLRIINKFKEWSHAVLSKISSNQPKMFLFLKE